MRRIVLQIAKLVDGGYKPIDNPPGLTEGRAFSLPPCLSILSVASRYGFEVKGEGGSVNLWATSYRAFISARTRLEGVCDVEMHCSMLTVYKLMRAFDLESPKRRWSRYKTKGITDPSRVGQSA